jgi:hypothetical protein
MNPNEITLDKQTLSAAIKINIEGLDSSQVSRYFGVEFSQVEFRWVDNEKVKEKIPTRSI